MNPSTHPAPPQEPLINDGITLSPEACLEASKLLDPRFRHHINLKLVNPQIHITDTEIDELESSPSKTALLEAIKSPHNLTTTAVLNHVLALGPAEASQIALLCKISSGSQYQQQGINLQNFRAIQEIVRRIQQEDAGWGSIDRVSGQGRLALRPKLDLAVNDAGGSQPVVSQAPAKTPE